MFKKIGLILSLAAVLVVATPAFAAEFIAPEKDNKQGNIVLNQVESHKNVYVVGASVTNNSDVLGDLYAAGGKIVVAGTVEQDVTVAGGDISLEASIGGDVRAAGGDIRIRSQIGGDVLVGAGNVIFDEKSLVGGDLYVGAGNVTIDGPVKGTLKIGGGEVVINSIVSGPVEVWSDGSLTFGPKAEVTGSIKYHGTKEAVVKEGARISSIELLPFMHAGRSTGDKAMGAFMTFLSLALFALVIATSFKPKTKVLVSVMQTRFWSSFGIGLLIAILGPIIAIILLLTQIGAYLGVVVIFSYGLLFALACSLATIFVGGMVMRYLAKREDLLVGWQSAVVGAFIVTLLCFIPYVGDLIAVILGLLAVGGTARLLSVEHKHQEEIATIISQNN